MLLTPAQIKPKSFESRQNSFFLLFFYPGWMRLMFTLLLQLNLSEGADSCAEIKSAHSVA